MTEPLDGERFCYLTTRGRTTGRPHTIEIWYAARGTTLYLLAGSGEDSDTVRNLRAHPEVDVRLGSRLYLATARVVEDPEEAALARARVPAKYGDEGEGLEEWAARALPVAIDLPPDTLP